jgi:hypothetical protein
MGKKNSMPVLEGSKPSREISRKFGSCLMTFCGRVGRRRENASDRRSGLVNKAVNSEQYRIR